MGFQYKINWKEMSKHLTQCFILIFDTLDIKRASWLVLWDAQLCIKLKNSHFHFIFTKLETFCNLLYASAAVLPSHEDH